LASGALPIRTISECAISVYLHLRRDITRLHADSLTNCSFCEEVSTVTTSILHCANLCRTITSHLTLASLLTHLRTRSMVLWNTLLSRETDS
jgi:hypothetical protein